MNEKSNSASLGKTLQGKEENHLESGIQKKGGTIVGSPHEKMARKTPETKIQSSRNWKGRNKERMRQYAKERYQKMLASPDLMAKKLESQRVSNKKNRAKLREYDRLRDKEKVRARTAVRKKIYKGRMKRLPCEVCGDTNSQAHHHDYTKRFEITFLCPKHHKELHHANH